jgi:hypothetical protein
LEDRSLGLVNGRLEPPAVDPKKGNHGGMPDTLVAVDERMVLNEREPQGCGLRHQTRIEVFASKRLPRLCDG